MVVTAAATAVFVVNLCVCAREIDVFTNWHNVVKYKIQADTLRSQDTTHDTHTQTECVMLLLLHVMYQSFIKCKWHDLKCIVHSHTSSNIDDDVDWHGKGGGGKE